MDKAIFLFGILATVSNNNNVFSSAGHTGQCNQEKFRQL